MYRGESLPLRITGVGDYDVRNMDFTLFLYPDGCICGDLRLNKEDFIPQEDGSYIGIFPGSVTARFDLTSYTLEIYDRTHEVIFVRPSFISVNESATSRIIAGD